MSLLHPAGWPTRSRTGRSPAWGLLLVLVALTSCHSDGAGKEAAIEVVQRFFTALPGGDCGELAPLLAPDDAGRQCSEVVEDFNAHGVRLLEVESAVRDGRDPEAILVRARLLQDGEPQRQLAVLRVVRHEGKWRLRP